MLRVLLLLICLAALSCKRAAETDSQHGARSLPELSPKLEARLTGGEAKPIDVKLAWHPPCRVPALADTEKDGQRGRTSFDAVLARDGDLMALSLERVRVIVINGLSVDSPTMRNQIQMANALAAAAMPTFLVSTSGEYLGVKDLDHTLDEVAKVLPGEVASRALPAMRTPEMRAMIDASSSIAGFNNSYPQKVIRAKKT